MKWGTGEELPDPLRFYAVTNNGLRYDTTVNTGERFDSIIASRDYERDKSMTTLRREQTIELPIYAGSGSAVELPTYAGSGSGVRKGVN
eukprot:scaffold29353_cov185-Isochrysis_galbana.AAC.1